MYTGTTEVNDVMFPNGSSDLVEPIYNNAVLSMPFNEQLADVISTYVQHRRQASAGFCLLLKVDYCLQPQAVMTVQACKMH